MSEQELLEENERLKEKIAFFERVFNRENAGSISAYNAIGSVNSWKGKELWIKKK